MSFCYNVDEKKKKKKRGSWQGWPCAWRGHIRPSLRGFPPTSQSHAPSAGSGVRPLSLSGAWGPGEGPCVALGGDLSLCRVTLPWKEQVGNYDYLFLPIILNA